MHPTVLNNASVLNPISVNSCFELQVSLVNRDHKQRVPSSRLPSAPRYSKHHVSETTGNVRSIPEEQQHVAKRATTMPIKRKTSEDHQKLVTTHSWSGTRDAGPKAGGMLSNSNKFSHCK